MISGVLLTGDAGTFCEITARKLSDNNYKIQYSDPMTITVNKIPQESPLRIENQLAVSVGEVALVTSGGSGDGVVSFTITTAGDAGCSISGGVLRATSNGSCGVSASKATSKNHLVATSAQRIFTFTRAEQSVFFTSAVPSDPRAGGSFTPAASITPAASSGSPRPITYSITEGSPTVCAFDSVDPTKVNFLTSGRCQITATQAGNDQFAQATADLLIVVGARNQTISFGALPERRFGQPAFMLQATASSGLAVSFQLAGNGSQACTVTSSGLVTLTRAGDCNITATQGGNAEFLAAPPVTQLLRVAADTAGAPHVVSISANNQSITASFNPPSYLGGSNTVGYRLELTDTQRPEDVYINPGCSNVGTPPLSCSIVGIPNNREYTVRVAAITQAGIGTYSQVSLPISTTKTSQAVSNLIATPTDGELRLDWEAPVVLDGVFRSYQVYVWPIELGPDAQPASPSETIETESATSVSFSTTANEEEPEPVMMMSAFSFFSAPELTSIAQADGYYVRVVTLTDGASTQVTDNTTTGIQQSFTTPGLVSEIELTDLSDELLVAWSTATFDGGHTVLGYQIRVNGELACELEEGEQYCSSASDRMFTHEELVLGQSYEFEVAAVNRLGVGVFASTMHQMPSIPSSSFGSDQPLDTDEPGKPGKPGKRPSILDPENWSPGETTGDTDGDTEGAGTDSTNPSDGSDSSASGSDSAEANFSWLLILGALLLLGALVRPLIRGRKPRVLG
jgi:hypothetical protein